MIRARKHWGLVILLMLIAASAVSPGFAQDSPREDEAAYTRTINERAAKIVETLDISDSAKAAHVRDIISLQYRDLSEIHGARDARIGVAREKSAGNEQVAAEIKVASDEANIKIEKLHSAYLSRLSEQLTPEQVDKVKDGMTYGVVPLTYRVYMEMLPNLTEEQRSQIKAWLIEARENAMDAGTAKEKHAWFGKYKGRVNNYLAAAGIDMKKAEKDLAARNQAAAGKNTKP